MHARIYNVYIYTTSFLSIPWCMYACMYVCMYVSMCSHTQTTSFLAVHSVCMYVCMYICMYSLHDNPVHPWGSSHTFFHAYIRKFMRVYTRSIYRQHFPGYSVVVHTHFSMHTYAKACVYIRSLYELKYMRVYTKSIHTQTHASIYKVYI